MSVGNYTHTLPAGFGACAVSSVNSARFLLRLVKKEIYGGIFYGKKKYPKRLLSLFLSVLMLATSLPFAGLSASAADESSNLPKSTSGAYLFAVF